VTGSRCCSCYGYAGRCCPHDSLFLWPCCSNYHVELNPSDVGNNDRYVVQEVIKELAKNRPLDVAGGVVGSPTASIWPCCCVYMLICNITVLCCSTEEQPAAAAGHHAERGSRLIGMFVRNTCCWPAAVHLAVAL